MKSLTVISCMLSALVISFETFANNTYTVMPSGGDDTFAIQAAFDAASDAGAGSIVQFTAGTFHVSEPIIVRGFSGEMRGAGREETIIEMQGDPNRPCHDLYGALPVQEGCFPITQYYVDDSPSLAAFAPFNFIGVANQPVVEVAIADLSLHFKGVTDVYYIHHVFAPNNAYLNAIAVLGERFWEYGGEISQASLSMDRVLIKGESESFVIGELLPFNILVAINVAGGGEGSSNFPDDYATRKIEYVQADVSVTRAHFDSVGIGLAMNSPIDSTIVMGGSNRNGNTYTNTGIAMRIRDPSNSRIEFSHNQGTVQNGATVSTGVQQAFGYDDGPQLDVPLAELSQVIFAHNDLSLQFILLNLNGGIYIEDWIYSGLGTKALDVLINKNKFHGLNHPTLGPTWGGIDIISGKDVIATNNKITGIYAVGGITTGYCFWCPVPVPADDIMILGNNVQNMEGGEGPPFFAGPIWLGIYTTGNTVVGGSNRTNVWDQGVDNTVVGVNNMIGNPPGPDIMEAMANRRWLSTGAP